MASAAELAELGGEEAMLGASGTKAGAEATEGKAKRRRQRKKVNASTTATWECVNPACGRHTQLLGQY